LRRGVLEEILLGMTRESTARRRRARDHCCLRRFEVVPLRLAKRAKTSGRAATAATGCPVAMGFPIVTRSGTGRRGAGGIPTLSLPNGRSPAALVGDEKPAAACTCRTASREILGIRITPSLEKIVSVSRGRRGSHRRLACARDTLGRARRTLRDRPRSQVAGHHVDAGPERSAIFG